MSDRSKPRVFVSPLVPGPAVLDADTSRYVVRVRRLVAGAPFLAFDPEARVECDAELVEANPRAARCTLGSLRAARLVSRLDVTLLQCASKGDKVDRVVRDATALGARRIVVCGVARSVSRPSEGGSRTRARWRRIATQAARQSGRGDCPELHGPVPLAEALEHARGLKLLLVPGGSLSLHAALDEWTAGTAACLLIGPEGGLAPAEADAAISAGFAEVTLGPFVLRTETAATAALAVLASRAPVE